MCGRIVHSRPTLTPENGQYIAWYGELTLIITMPPLFFIHIPKTAGTSFREAAIKHWSAKKVLSDYGASKHSSPVVTRLVHADRDYHQFNLYLEKQSIKMLSGHAPVRFYRRIFPANRLITFVRDPVERVISHFRTACQFQSFSGSLEEFCTNPENINLQSRYLAQMPIELIGFIGLTERFEESLQLFNQQYNQKFLPLQLNQQASIERGRSKRDEVSQKEHDLITLHNGEDIALYAAAKQLFESRLTCSQQNVMYSYAKVQSLHTNRIQGWAVGADESAPRQIEILVNDRSVAIKTALEYLPAMKERNAGREGYVGFIHAFNPPLATTDKVVVRDTGNGVVLRGPTKPVTPPSPMTGQKPGNRSEQAPGGR